MEMPLIKEAIEGFELPGKLISYERYGSGHINETYLVVYEEESLRRYIFQRMSKALTKQSDLLMENIVAVTTHLKNKIISAGGDVFRETLNVIKAPDGKNYFIDSSDEYWRVYYFIEDATSFDRVEDKKYLYESGVSFGNFQRLLSDFDASALFETIPGFHDTKKRYEKFLSAVNEDRLGRVKDALPEIEFVKSHDNLTHVLSDLLAKGQLPLRVTHNDTKLNNIMIDNKSGKGICVIDLDTVMPGLSVNDFGDGIRFGANTAAEDEKDLSKVSLDIDLYRTYLEGFLEGVSGALTKKEIEMLPMGAMVMTYECGIRFLTDYLEGDVYFHIARAEHNLDRARTQFELIKDMEKKWELMQV